MKNNKGFTILEMMIVLSIIALVFLLTLPNIQQKEKIIRSKGCLRLPMHRFFCMRWRI